MIDDRGVRGERGLDAGAGIEVMLLAPNTSNDFIDFAAE